ncbi:MAG: C-terminal binding protein [Fibrobacteres bacterium]|nr:C-terminal binding protein [Fibrobacterota bacterium]
MKVVLLEDRYAHHDYEKGVLKAVGAEVVESKASTPAEIIAVAGEADGITVNLAPITAEVISGLKKCKVIARYGVGFDSVDIKAAGEKGIMVVNVPDYCDEDVSDQALALLVSCARQTALHDKEVRKGNWNIRSGGPMFRFKGKVLGIAGYGRIPQCLHKKLKGFGFARVLVADPFVPKEVVEKAGAELVDLTTLLKESDYVSAHVPLSDKTKHMFGKEQFAMMKKTAIFVNTARGGIVDTAALYDALKNKTIAWAGLDVHEQEPVAKDYPLFALDNCVLSDHVGWYSEESQVDLQTKAAKAVAEALSGKTPQFVVNKQFLK